MDTLNYEFLGFTTDGLLIFQDRGFPSDAPQAYPAARDLCGRASTDQLFDGDKYFVVSRRHAEVRGLLHLALENEETEGDTATPANPAT